MRGQHILGLEHMSPLDIERVLDTAAEMKKLVGRQKNKKLSVLREKQSLTSSLKTALAPVHLSSWRANILVPTSSILQRQRPAWLRERACAIRF